MCRKELIPKLNLLLHSVLRVEQDLPTKIDSQCSHPCTPYKAVDGHWSLECLAEFPSPHPVHLRVTGLPTGQAHAALEALTQLLSWSLHTPARPHSLLTQNWGHIVFSKQSLGQMGGMAKSSTRGTPRVSQGSLLPVKVCVRQFPDTIANN